MSLTLMKTNTMERYGAHWHGMDYTLAGRAVRMLTDLRTQVMERDEDTTSEYAMKLWSVRNYIVDRYRRQAPVRLTKVGKR